MLVVGKDLVGCAVVDNWKLSALAGDLEQVLDAPVPVNSSATTLSRQRLPEGQRNSLSDRGVGKIGQLSSEIVGFFILDIEGHVFLHGGFRSSILPQ